MNQKNRKAIDIISKSIVKATKLIFNDATFDRTYQGKISKVFSSNQYEVEINGAKYTIYSSINLSFANGDMVWITAPQNNFSSIYISGKRM